MEPAPVALWPRWVPSLAEAYDGTPFPGGTDPVSDPGYYDPGTRGDRFPVAGVAASIIAQGWEAL